MPTGGESTVKRFFFCFIGVFLPSFVCFHELLLLINKIPLSSSSLCLRFFAHFLHVRVLPFRVSRLVRRFTLPFLLQQTQVLGKW
jgi:hypothetical protein